MEEQEIAFESGYESTTVRDFGHFHDVCGFTFHFISLW